MKRLILGLGFAALALSSSVSAHPVGSVYESRGQCESALGQINVQDAFFLVDVIGEFETIGEAERFFHDIFDCERQGEQWVLVFNPPEE